jgi:hypothetical protein
MQHIETLFIITFGISAISSGIAMFLSFLLFRSLKKNYAVYYKSIGEPIVVMFAKLTDTEDEVIRNYIRGLKGAAFGYRMIFRGVPKRFPGDVDLRRLAQSVRVIATITLVSFTMLIVVGYFFYKSTS